MRRVLPLAFALAAVALAFPPLSAQRPVFTTGTPAEIAQARTLGLERIRAIGLQKGIEGSNDLVVTNAHVDRRSMAHTRVQQRFQGIPVLGGEAIAHFNADGSRFAETDNLITGVSVSATPRLTASAAIDIAATDYGCRRCLTATPSADLWIVRDDAGVDHLTYRVQMTRLDGTSETALPVRFVDAHGGYVVLSYDNLQTGTGNSFYSGTVEFATWYSGSSYSMFDLYRHIGTYTLANSTFSATTLFSSSDVWNQSYQRAGIDAHYGAEQFFDYLQSVHGRNGIDGAGGPLNGAGVPGVITSVITSHVRYGVDYNDSFWEPTRGIAVYGDGDGIQFGPLVTLDNVGHEMTHGVIQFTAGLLYHGESGAINESWSDVFGAMLERDVKGESSNTWLIREQAYTPATAGDALRYLDDPHRASDRGWTANDDPDHYSERCRSTCPDTAQGDNGGVHVNSGIANKAFYLLAKGGTHHLGGSMTGIGADAAAQIWFTALSYMTSTTNFAGARDATMLAAVALYGVASPEHEAVTRAWCLVGVGTCAGVDAIAVSPNAGWGMTQTFTFQFSDAAGAADLSSARVRFATSATQGAGTCSAWYDATTATIKLMNDDGTWGAPVPLGGGTLSNSQCTLNLASSTATPNGDVLSLALNITFSTSFRGQKNMYMLAGSAAAPTMTTGWIQRGTWSVLSVAALSVTPNTGSGWRQTFTMHYADAQGASDLSSARVRFGSPLVGSNSCTAWYDATDGSIGLLNDAGTAWTEGVMGAGTLTNSQCELNLVNSSATANGNDLTVVLDITFAPAFAGAKPISMLALSPSGANTGWQPRGTWAVTPPAPQAISVSPNSGIGITQAFTVQYSHPNGAAALTSARVRFVRSGVFSGEGTCTVWYNASTAMIRLINDNGTWGAWVPLGSGTVSNSQCTLDLATSAASLNGDTLTLVLQLTFSIGFSGENSMIYMLAGDATTTTSWALRGHWTVPSTVSRAVSVSPNNASGAAQAFTLRYLDRNGAGSLLSVRVRFGVSNVGPGTCSVRYYPMSGVIELADDPGFPWLQGSLGSGTLSNSQCTLNLASSSVTASGMDLTLVLNVTFKPAFAGVKGVYMLAQDVTESIPGWVQMGTWRVPQ